MILELGWSMLGGALLISFLLQLFFFAIAFSLRTDRVTDLSYGLTFLLLAALAWVFGQQSLPLLLAVGMVSAWSVRITSYLFIRISVIKRDKRFDGIRENFWSFALFWLVQAIAVWVIMLPVLVLAGFGSSTKIPTVSVAGLAIWLIALLIETIADWQKFTFKLKPKNKEKWIDQGLWKYARHPNYFGEMSCWWGVFLFTAPLFTQGWQLLTVISPIFITSLLVFFSGIPPLEKKYNQRYKGNKQYAAYKKRTNVLVPIPYKLPLL